MASRIAATNSINSVLVLLGAAVVAVATGFTLGSDRFLIALLVTGIALGFTVLLTDAITLSGWCVILLVTTVVARAPVALLGLPQVEMLNFIHYPVVIGMAWAANKRPKPEGRSSAPGKWLLGLAIVAVLSTAANGSHPLRTVLFLVIIGEPLVIIWAITRWGVDDETRRKLTPYLIALVAVQVPLGISQGLSLGWTDAVQGTLIDHGAGAHVLGALFSLTLCVVTAATFAGRMSTLVGVGCAVTCMGMIAATGAMAIMITTGAALLLAVIFGVWEGGAGVDRRFRFGAVAVVIGLSVSSVWLAESLVPGIFDRAQRLTEAEAYPELELVTERSESNIEEALLGSGPGTYASRASLLLTDTEVGEGSPLAFVGLGPTEAGLEIARQDQEIIEQQGGSADLVASSAMGIIGDLGLIGLAGVFLFFWSLWRETRSRGHWLGGAVRASIIMMCALIFLDNWLEYPEWSGPFAILVGFALAGPSATTRGSSREREEAYQGA
jgi:hypothetical protein